MSEVKLRCYDLSRGTARMLSGALFGQSIDAVYHTGILCRGTEWYYGGGIQFGLPEAVEEEYGMKPCKIIDLGTTTKSMREIEQWCDENRENFSDVNYDVLHHNCNHFSDSLSRFLLDGVGIPPEILHQHEEVARLPGGAFIIKMIEQFQKDAKNNADRTGLAGFVATGRARGNLTGVEANSIFQAANVRPPPIPAWTERPNDFEMNLRKLWESEGVTEEQKVEACRRLYLLSDNILKNATNPKYRTIMANNQRLKDTILAVPNGRETLESLGFQYEERDDGKHVYTIGTNVQKARLFKLMAAAKVLKPIIDSGLTPPPPPPDQRITTPNISPPVLQTTPAQKYSFQLQKLEELGFRDKPQNIKALTAANGNINQAVDQLLLLHGGEQGEDS